jgi:hypothetical protein
MMEWGNVQCGWYGWSCFGLCLRELELGRWIAFVLLHWLYSTIGFSDLGK